MTPIRARSSSPASHVARRWAWNASLLSGCALLLGGAAGVSACTSKPQRAGEAGRGGERAEAEGDSTQPARAPFAAVYQERGRDAIVALVLEPVNPKETPRYFDHPSIRALDQAFARHSPGRVSVETDDDVVVLTRRVASCEERNFQGPCPETVYAASLARRKSAAIEARAPGSGFARFLPPPGAGGQTAVVMAVFSPRAFEADKKGLEKRLGAPRYFVPLEYRGK